MAIGSPPITWDLKHIGELCVYTGTPLPVPLGNTGRRDGICVCLSKFPLLLYLNNCMHNFQLADGYFMLKYNK